MNIQTTVRTEIKEMDEGFCVFVYFDLDKDPDIISTKTREQAEQWANIADVLPEFYKLLIAAQNLNDKL